MEDERESWNRRYGEGSHAAMRPDPLLVRAYQEYIQPLFPEGGSALDAAGGLGRHAIWLARRNWAVTLVDISDVAMAIAQQKATRHARQIHFQTSDLKKFKAGYTRYDLILVFLYLERKILPELQKALRPGGLLVYKTYTRDQRQFKGSPTHPLHLLRENELLHAFRGLRVLHYSETIRGRGVAEFVGRKPGGGVYT